MIYKNFADMPLVLEVGDLADTLAIGRNKAYELCHSGRLKILRVGQQIRIPDRKSTRLNSSHVF